MTTDQDTVAAPAEDGERADASAAKKPRRRARKPQAVTAAAPRQERKNPRENGVTPLAAPPPSSSKASSSQASSSQTSGEDGKKSRAAASRKTSKKSPPVAEAPAENSSAKPSLDVGAAEAPQQREGMGEDHRSSSGGEPGSSVKKTAHGASAASAERPDAVETDRDKGRQARGGKGRAAAKRRMFVSILPGEQVEVALAEDGVVQEYYLDMLHQRKIKGNIYKGVVQNVDTNLQAAFVNFGSGKNGFLQIDEIHPEYWQVHHEPAKGRKFPPIQKVLKVGQDVLVQVVKEPTGGKGAFLTTWLSLAGRFLVLTPGQEQTGVSRKVEDGEERGRLRELMGDIDPGPGLGVIVRTVSAGATKTTLKSDLQYLKRVWRDIRKKGTEVSSPDLVYEEPGLSERAVRDYLTDDVTEVWVDNEDIAGRVRETANLLFPRKKNLIRLHTDARQPLWERFNLRRQLDQIYSREVVLPSGGRLVFDQTEALMAVDVNSGKISGKANFEAMAYKTNLEAAEIVARQLKLRDVGGQVVIDFIEMREKKHTQEVEKTLSQAMKNDRARHDVGRMSSFGLLELVRQRTGSSALSITMEPCPACGGTGQRRNLEWQALQALRDLRRLLQAESSGNCRFETSQDVALYLLNHKRDSLREMEQEYGKCLEITVRL
ncbi:MAG: Rne/Rng family ribonuclease [Desulfovibrio sp.]|nr:Rne/Rng family ribonuclease [Desulfovibrio sp.]